MVGSRAAGFWYEAFTKRYAMHRKTLSLSFGPFIICFFINTFTFSFRKDNLPTMSIQWIIRERSCLLFKLMIAVSSQWTNGGLSRFSSQRREDPSFTNWKWGNGRNINLKRKQSQIFAFHFSPKKSYVKSTIIADWFVCCRVFWIEVLIGWRREG